ncbi:MAG: Fe-S cluster assembly protein SufD [Rhodospirillaceae bacterium]|nr:Fe-S cluster assembly protein SufD [Rhodospirillaceae bacterium]
MNGIDAVAVQRSVPFPYADQFAAVAPSLPGAALPWLRQRREQAIERFTSLGLPTPRTEAWKYTNLAPLLKPGFRPVAGPNGYAAGAADATLPDAAARLVFVNGLLRQDLGAGPDLPPGVTLLSLEQALHREPDLLATHLGGAAPAEGRPLVALNEAFMAGGYVLRIAAGTAVDRPLHLVFVAHADGAALAFHPRNLVVAEAGSRVVLVETHLGGEDAQAWANPVTEVFAGPGASVEHHRFHDEGAAAFHVGLTAARLAEGASYDSLVLATGGALSRHEIHVALAGERARCRLLGGFLMRGRQHVDNTTEVVHAAPRTTSRQLYKGALDDEARGVFQGRVTVRPAAQKTDGHQLCRTLLLSRRAEMDTKPELEIYADDVKCSHGATGGELDDSALFYMRTRGLDEAAARRLLTEAFLAELVDGVACAATRSGVEARIARWLAAAFDKEPA